MVCLETETKLYRDLKKVNLRKHWQSVKKKFDYVKFERRLCLRT